MIAWLIPIVGEKLARPVFFGLLALLLIGGTFTLARCTGGNDEAEEQAQQTNRSGEAIATAAAEAIDTITGRTVTDQAVDQAVDQATKEIANAQDADSVRSIVVASVCGQPAHRNDPACRMR